MTRITATEDGRATETMTRYYERFARGGFGAVSTEGIYTDQAFSQGYVYQPGMTDEAQANAWKPIVWDQGAWRARDRSDDARRCDQPRQSFPTGRLGRPQFGPKANK